MLNNFDNTDLIQSARSTGRGFKLWLELLIIILISTVGLFATQFIATLPVVLVAGVENEMNELQMTIVGLYTTFATTVALCAYCAWVQKRPLRSIGFTSNNSLKQYIKGLIIGFILFGAVIVLGVFFNAFSYNGLDKKINFGMIFVLLIGFFFQGMSEEVLCRGFIMTSIARKHSVLIGVIVNTIVFTALHFFNPGFGLIPAINLALFSVFTSIYMLNTGDIWGVSAIHSIWNFVQGSFYGLSVSGTDILPTIFKFEQTEKFLLNGGKFGPEGGLLVTIVLIIGVTILMFTMPINKMYTVEVGKENNNGRDNQPTTKN